MAVLFLQAAACPGVNPPPAPPPDAAAACVDTDGSNDPAGSGHVFLLDQLGFANVSDCLDRDGDGTPDCAINHAWRPLLPMINGLFGAAIANGRILMALEVAGLCAPYDGADPAATIKLYPSIDVDGDPTNNLCGGPGCGQVLARARYLEDGQTVYRGQPKPVVDFVASAEFDSQLNIELDAQAQPLVVRQLALHCLVPETMSEIPSGVMCGVAPVRQLAFVKLPLCDASPILCQQARLPADLSLAEYLAVLGEQPDVDLDGDGLERFELDGNSRVLICYDGDGRVMGAKDCLQDPQMQDGYSVCFKLHGIPGAIVGVNGG